MYGGLNHQKYNGSTNTTSSFYETIHVLSLPLFQWSLVAVPKYNIARYAHSCNVVGNRQMLAIGGIMKNIDHSYNALVPYELCDPSILYQVFDLTAHEWTDGYNASAAPYELNSNLVKLVGGRLVILLKHNL